MNTLQPETHAAHSDSVNYTEGFPKFFRNEGTCVRVDSDQHLTVIKLPPEVQFAQRYTSTYPSKERLWESLESFEPVQMEVFKNFSYTFLQAVANELENLRSKLKKL